MNKGFTLIELITVMAIIGIMSLVLLGNQGDFTANLALKSSADNIVLAFREAQVKGLAVSENPNDPENFDIGYGVYASKDGIAFFVDENNDYVFDGNVSSCNGECLRKIELNKNVSVLSVEGGQSAVFKRPRPEAVIRDVSGSVTEDMVISIEHGSGEIWRIEFAPSADINVVKSE